MSVERRSNPLGAANEKAGGISTGCTPQEVATRGCCGHMSRSDGCLNQTILLRSQASELMPSSKIFFAHSLAVNSEWSR